jgi:superfamily II DNA helicase RecQ
MARVSIIARPIPAFDIEVIAQLVKDQFRIQTIKAWQLACMRYLVEGHDLVVTAGTGSGKSLIFQGVVLARQGGIVLVISPLKGLMHDQVWT